MAYGGTSTAGYNLPYPTSYMSLVYIASKANPVIALVAAITFLVNVIWLLTVALIMCQRAMFAWGMDRMGPRWFTEHQPPLRLADRHVRPRGRHLGLHVDRLLVPVPEHRCRGSWPPAFSSCRSSP